MPLFMSSFIYLSHVNVVHLFWSSSCVALFPSKHLSALPLSLNMSVHGQSALFPFRVSSYTSGKEEEELIPAHITYETKPRSRVFTAFTDSLDSFSNI